ncbi:cation-transporting ATPase [Microbacterium sp. M28]|uniref:cation-transporting ATPase n=1 Tax=Microbacterium sp. M28 TaxID=2962064 RepID=UPI0021F4C283|nr:cation-transporting ATPase [Microbacterium sp. M28]UYO98014.1 cation-transporting ATPase [Microbacterium sp. M28]
MDKISRLLGMASQALDKKTAANRGGSSGSTDWGGILRGAVDAVRTPSGPGNAGTPMAGTSAYAPPPADGAGPYTPPPAAGGRPYTPPPAHGQTPSTLGSDADRAAIARYDYLMQTAEPHRVEQIHRDAFARLSPEQRAHVAQRMQAEFGPGERPASASADDLARAAGRAEAAQPGRMRGLLSRVKGGGAGGAAFVAGGAALGALGAVAAGAVLSAAAAPLLEHATAMGVDFAGLAEGLDLEALAGGAEGLLGSAGDTVAGAGESVSDWGSALGDLGLGDIFGR